MTEINIAKKLLEGKNCKNCALLYCFTEGTEVFCIYSSKKGMGFPKNNICDKWEEM